MIRILGALAEASRFIMLRELCSGEKCVSELGRSSGVSQSCATRHLQALERAGLVTSRRDGKRVAYQLARQDPPLNQLVRWAVAADRPGAQGEAAAAGTVGAGRMAAPASRPANAVGRASQPGGAVAFESDAASGPWVAGVGLAEREYLRSGRGRVAWLPPGWVELEDYLL
jgi:DNA-binding transcriptional ArsR family regulator